MSEKIFKNFIDGKWCSSLNEEIAPDLNPSDTRDVIGYYQKSTREDAKRAILSAHNAFEHWRKIPSPERGRIFMKAAEIINKRIDELAEILTREEGKTLSEAKGEIKKGLNIIEFFGGEGFRLCGSTYPSEIPNNFLYTIRQPLGVVSIITPWNFPWAIPCWKIAPALVAGNTVVFKPASLTPLIAIKLIEILLEAGIPEGVINLVTGSGSTVGDEIIRHPLVKVISFTGSTATGREVNKIGGERLVKVTCEMGGKNPVVVMPDCDLDIATIGILNGAFGSTGQRCTATSRVIVLEEIAQSLIEKLVSATKNLKVGNPMNPNTDIGPAVDENQLNIDLEYISIGIREGAKILCGGKRILDEEHKYGYFVEPTIFDNVSKDMRIAKEEIFGPVLCIMRAKTLDTAIEIANSVEYGLTSSIYTRDISVALKFVEEIEAGMVHINSPTIGGEAQVPFGGIKSSGIGEREMAKEGINFFTELKTVFFDYTGEVRKLKIY